MSGSDSEPENHCYYGTPLPAYDEDSIPRKRPITVEEQIATDAQGRRRFHGAFTGGFSAGFFNTVGSLEGWTPKEFKSSRSEKTSHLSQKPEDFMDDEDLGEDGFAPQVVRATNEYNTSRKRKKQVFSEGPIPGEPVLHNIFSSGNETIGYMLLKNLRLKDHKKQKESGSERTYGCQMPKPDESDIIFKEENQYQIPAIYKDFLKTPKTNTFGLGYSGLDKSQFSLFSTEEKQSSKLMMTDKNNKKLSISGQAFGVGAFEDEDDDIYMKEDMTRYDFELTGEKAKKEQQKTQSNLIFDLFVQSKVNPVLKSNVKFPPPTIPYSFTGKHKIKKSRFEPIPENEAVSSTIKINPMIRAKYLGEDTNEHITPSKPVKVKEETLDNKPKETSKKLEPSGSQASSNIDTYLTDRFVSSSKVEDVSNILEPVERIETIHGTDQMRDAVRMKMFGPLTRVTSDWVPSSLLCKRFNVPEPFVDRPESSRKRTKNIIFQYQKHIEEETLQPGLNKEEPPIPELPEGSIEPEIKQENDPVTNKTTDENNTQEPEINEKNISADKTCVEDLTAKIDLESKQDLFKAIFMSSDSESDEERQENKNEVSTNKADNEKQNELKTAVLSDQLIPKIIPRKEGILSGIDCRTFSMPVVKTEKKIPENIPKEELNDGWYGPKLPEQKTSQKTVTVTVVSSDSEDEWVEKGESTKKKKKNKKEKKHKKHKKNKHEKSHKYKD
ncbi:G patch domain-containing protein 1 homolog [Anthonomus grandis grandis]|uniref:G patch domain-containing protein 1 homolog n=1 Tax=Anthonomus grandis grandis TaxID=2921223 RepID=UPI00216658A8|nr:G patch domain-containing protein 1 homolog [Anthonomus grandis grandis]